MKRHSDSNLAELYPGKVIPPKFLSRPLLRLLSYLRNYRKDYVWLYVNSFINFLTILKIERKYHGNLGSDLMWLVPSLLDPFT